ncbi:dienelactone hydrolase family protein [Curvibacter sp. PAE-UM]|uniref:dienelactone hydrolase family protein n=1 Tax=Curvibacter sp. PAE-UM TaxID=1714344 RepID=UPI0012E33181|nr:prolyl oligopeptidase family serine peptidase [Curvibacter sp. PAE-UM]
MHALVQGMILALSLGVSVVSAQDIRVEKIDLSQPLPNGPDLKVLAEVRIPKSAVKLALVLVLPNAGGLDGTGPQYIKALNERGIATAELNPLADDNWIRNVMMSKIVMAQSVRNFGVDPDRIGIMGFSHGAMVSLVASSESLMARVVRPVNLRFRAHAALYPVCSLVYDANRASFMNWKTARPAEGGDPNFYKGMFDKMTGAKTLLLAARNEDYEDAPTACPKLVTDMNASAPGLVDLVIYPDAGHGWDVPASRSYQDHISRKNGRIQHTRSQSTFEQSLTAVTDFFVRELAPR